MKRITTALKAPALVREFRFLTLAYVAGVSSVLL